MFRTARRTMAVLSLILLVVGLASFAYGPSCPCSLGQAVGLYLFSAMSLLSGLCCAVIFGLLREREDHNAAER
jgi:hypothetical protein